jgi:small subunit ribosomal protein S1
MNESWWEAVLAEDEAQHIPLNSKFSSQNGSERKYSETQNEEEIEQLDWEEASLLYEQDQVVSLTVTGCNRGGLLVQGDGLQGFVPLSHLIGIECGEDNPEDILEQYQDSQINLKIIECDPERGRIVFSERAAQASPGSRKRLLENLSPGDCTWGTVTNITDFGVFVDLGGVEGLVHVSEISWGRVHHPADVVSIGQDVEVYVIQIDQDRARIALSLKRLKPNPWETAEGRYHVGQITKAVVTSIVSFGAFARLEEGLDGLIHISEFSQLEPTEHMDFHLCEGLEIQVRVLHVDATKQRLGLSLKLEGEPF